MADTSEAGGAADQVAIVAADLEAEGFENVVTVGRGGFGVVFRCLQRTLDRLVAIKVLTADQSPDNFARFLREQRAMGRLSGHPNIVTIHHYGTTRSGRPYIVMQFHPRGSLESRIRRSGPIGWRDSLSVGVKMAGALETAHRLGMLHRDVKPANILLTDYGEPQLTDFGIAHVAGGFETQTGVIMGSPAYTAPEVLRGQTPTPAADIYGLGATLFCAITGHAAFARRDGEQLVAQFLRISEAHVPDLRESGVPAAVSAAIEHAMAPEPKNRPTSARAWGDELRGVEQRTGLVVADMALPAPSSVQPPTEESTQAHPLPEVTASAGVSADSVLTPPTPSTKYRPPVPNRPMVERRRLVDVLRTGRGRRLTLIHGPAGYGKTTLAAQWRTVLAEEGTAVAWLSVDPDDNNVVWFLSHLVEAVRQVRPTLAKELGQALEEHGDQAERYVLSTLINEIDHSGDPVAVVLDDWHRVTSKETRAAVGLLLDHCCALLQVIVTSRTRSGLPLSRMRVRDELLEVDAAALRFDLSESRSFLVDLGGLALGDRDVEKLTESTDGWVAALQLASLSLRGSDDPVQMIGNLSGRHHAIGEFLAENVLDTLDPGLLDFLMATSITARVSGDLASILAAVPDGQTRLEEVEQQDLFLRRIDEEGQWFRYHHLFADYLRRRLERGRGDRLVELHRRAARWFADHRFLSEAVDHALAGGDEQQAVEFVEKDGTYLLEHSQMSTLLGLVAKLPPLRVADSAPLQLSVAWANLLLQHVDQARGALSRIRPSLDASTLPVAERESIRVEALVAESVLEIYSDRIAGVDALVEEALGNPDILRPWAVSVAANVKTFCLIYRFDYAAVPPLQDWARAYHGRTGGPFSVMYGYAFAGIAAYEQLDLAAAESHFMNAVEVASRAGGPHSHATRLAGALLGELRYEQGRIDEAERLIEESYELGFEGGVVDFMIARYVVGARIKAWRGDLDAAAGYLADGTRAAELLGLDRLRARVDNECILLGLPTSTEAATARPHCLYAESSTDGIGQVIALIEDDTAIRSLLDQERDPGHRERAVTWARQRWQSLAGTARRRTTLEAARLLVTCLAAAGHTEEAKAHLSEAAAICADQGMNHFLLDGGERLTGLVVALDDDRRAGRWKDGWATVPGAYLEAMAAAARHSTP